MELLRGQADHVPALFGHSFNEAGLVIRFNKKQGGLTMSEHCCGIRVGEVVPDFKIETFEPAKGDFGEVSLEALKKAGRWTVLFFYPADFTFV
jgi:hypothetical protein